jgi:hypothetical protein
MAHAGATVTVRASEFITPHFTWDEFACNDAICTPFPLDWRASRAVPLANELERLRMVIGPFTPTSVFRTWAHHAAIYAAMRPRQTPPAQSEHLAGRAADVPCPATGMTWEAFVNAVRGVAAQEDSRIRYVKFYRRQKFCHLDIRPTTAKLMIEFEA